MLFSSCWWCSRFPHIYPTNLGEVWVCQSGGRHTLWNFGRVLLDVLRIRQGKFVDKNRQRFLEISLSNFIKISAQPQTLSNFEIRQSFRQSALCRILKSSLLLQTHTPPPPPPPHTHTHTQYTALIKKLNKVVEMSALKRHAYLCKSRWEWVVDFSGHLSSAYILFQAISSPYLHK